MARGRKKRRNRAISGIADVDHQLNLDKLDPVRKHQLLNAPASDYPDWLHGLMSKLPEMTELQSLEVALQLQKVLSEEAALLNNPDMSENIAKLKQRAAERDKVKEEFETNRVKFVESVIHNAEKNKPTGEQADRIKVAGQQMLQTAIRDAKVSRGAKQQHMDMLLDYGPKEKIWVTPRVMRINDIETLLPIAIRIGRRQFILQPGENEVPVLVANEYRQRVQAEKELRSREASFKQADNIYKLEKDWAAIDREHGTAHEIDPRLRS